MNEPIDSPERVRAITELESTLLVEAAAGTGKTAIMAARVTFILAEGNPPGKIAAITFTEPAASGLAERIEHYIEELLRGECPKPLLAALPDGPTEYQKDNLRRAATQLDELTVTTIHAFCRTIISSYAVEANIDPGARILDGDQARAVFGDIFERWLKRRLDGTAMPTDAIAVLSRDNPREVAATLRELALTRLEHRLARTLPPDLTGRPDLVLLDALDDFRRWVAAAPGEPRTAELIEDLERLCAHFQDSFATPPDFAKLWALAHPPRVDRLMRWKSLELKEPKLKTAWKKVAGEAGASFNNEAMAHFDAVHRAYRAIMGRIASAVVARLAVELEEILDEYEAYKRAAALLDFDSLLERAKYLVTTHDDVRRELGKRYAHILVDEFQDTDPLQSQILFQIAADRTAANWIDNELRPGALFLVGDPKQSIYRFRGADINAYELVRAAIKKCWPDNIVTITTNFRSRPGILAHVNARFAAPLGAEGQPGYVALTAFLAEPAHGLPAVARLKIDTPREPKADDLRDAEAEGVAVACKALIGRFEIEEDGKRRPLRAGDITLLSPTRTGLWRYERTLEDAGLPIASQAGKGLFRRQETQDMLALARLLADPTDTLAFGAFMRGPFVGLAEEVLLDITAALPTPASGRSFARFSLRTDPEHVAHEHARHTLAVLRELRRKARAVTPAQLLTEAVERLAIRSILSLREPYSGGRGIANLEAFIERARPFGVRGLKNFVREITRDVAEGRAASEGQLDSDGDAINIITLHSAKGLEWPVVIPVNMATMPRPRDTFVHRVSDNTIHMTLGDVVPPELMEALEGEEVMALREQQRLWYVTCTRARELLVIPHLAEAGPKSWARIIDHGFDGLAELELRGKTAMMPPATAETANAQTKDVFEAERARIAVVSKPISWRRPSDGDDDRAPVVEALASEPGDMPEAETPIGAGRLRGLVLHKLMEEIFSAEIADDLAALTARAAELTASLEIEDGEDPVLPDAAEMAKTVARTLAHPEITALRPRLVAEWPLYGLLAPRTDIAVSARIDAIAVADGKPDVVIDWKSDVQPTEATMTEHGAQIADYLRLSGAPRGALFYMTSGTIRWVGKEAR